MTKTKTKNVPSRPLLQKNPKTKQTRTPTTTTTTADRQRDYTDTDTDKQTHGADMRNE